MTPVAIALISLKPVFTFQSGGRRSISAYTRSCRVTIVVPGARRAATRVGRIRVRHAHDVAASIERVQIEADGDAAHELEWLRTNSGAGGGPASAPTEIGRASCRERV